MRERRSGPELAVRSRLAVVDPALEEQIRAHLQSDQAREAVAAAISGYGPRVLAAMYGRLRDEAAAGEAFSLWYEALLLDIGGFRGESSFLAWALVVARHAMYRYLTQARRRAGRELPLVAEERVGGGGAPRTDTHPYQRSEVRQRAMGLLLGLRASERELLELHLLQGLSWPEIAKRQAGEALAPGPLQRRAAALRQRYARALSALRQRWRDDGDARLEALWGSLSERERWLLRETLLKGRPLPEVVAEEPGHDLPGERERLRALLKDLDQRWRDVGLLPAEAVDAGLLSGPEAAGAAPAKDGRVRGRRIDRPNRE